MASDEAFNKKYFTTGHTGFGIPLPSSQIDQMFLRMPQGH